MLLAGSWLDTEQPSSASDGRQKPRHFKNQQQASALCSEGPLYTGHLPQFSGGCCGVQSKDFAGPWNELQGLWPAALAGACLAWTQYLGVRSAGAGVVGFERGRLLHGCGIGARTHTEVQGLASLVSPEHANPSLDVVFWHIHSALLGQSVLQRRQGGLGMVGEELAQRVKEDPPSSTRRLCKGLVDPMAEVLPPQMRDPGRAVVEALGFEPEGAAVRL